MERFQGKNDIPANGWELIRRDLGYNDAGSELATSNPFVILYNKYLGTLRVFVTVQKPQTNFQFAEVKLVFSSSGTSKAATLNRQSALGVALEDTEKGQSTEFSAISRYLNDTRKWFVADFPMDYDPCVCQFDSRLRIEVNLIKKATVNLQSATTGSITTDASAGTSDGPSFFKKAVGATNGAINAAGTSFDNVNKLTNRLIASGGDKTALGSLGGAIKQSDFLKSGLQNLPYIGAALGLLDFFIGGGQDSTPQPIALQPLAIQMSTKTTGTIQDTSLYVTPYFFNPGNRIANTRPTDVPYYNETMGVFSLLKRPTVDVQLTTPYVGNAQIMKYSFRLTNDLQYVINPAAHLAVQEFQAALVFESPTNATPTRPYYDFGGIQAFEGPTISATGSPSYLYRTDYTDALFIKNNIYAYTTPVPSNGYRGTGFYHTNVYLKVLLNLRRTDCSTCQNVLYVARYPVNVNNVSSYTSIPSANSGVLPQANASAVNAICRGSKYTTAIALRQAKPAAHVPALSDATAAPSLTAYPNPTSGTVRFSLTTTQPGHVRVALSDAMGREVKQIIDEDKSVAATFDILAHVEDLAPGIYYCIMQTSSGQRVVQKLVIVP